MARISQQAAEWDLLHKQGTLDASERERFQEWLRSPQHLKALADICVVDMVLHRARLTNARPARFDSVDNIVAFEWPASDREQDLSRTDARRSGSRWRARAALTLSLATAASIVAIAFLVAMFAGIAAVDGVLVTVAGEWDKRLFMEDGSVVYLAPKSEVRVHFSEHLRSLSVTRGEALFEVAKDPNRPFVVGTEAGTVKAVGTAFAVVYRGDEVVVTVSEGKVAVNPNRLDRPLDPSSASTIAVAANQQLILPRIPGKGRSKLIEDIDADRELKWIRNWFESDGESVGQIVAELNRRHDGQVMVSDPQIAKLKLNSLSFKPSEPQAFVDAVNAWYADYPNAKGGAALSLQPH